MGKNSKTLVISGYYGFGNSGDEAVLQSILLALQQEEERQGVSIEPVVLSIRPEETAATYGVRSVHRMKVGQMITALRGSDGLISGGGSLLQDVTGLTSIPYYLGVIRLAQWLKRPTFIYSQGLGPVNRRWFDPWIRSAFARAAYISVRDQASADYLQRVGLAKEQVQVVPDPVMGLPLKGTPNGIVGDEAARPAIGVSVRYWNPDRSELDRLAIVLNQIRAACNADIRFLPFHHPSDVEASEYVRERMESEQQGRGDPGTDRPSVEIIRGAIHPQDMLAQVGACRLLIGMRLHSLIYAATQQVPMAGISYDPKIDHFLGQLGMSAVASTQAFDVNAVVAQIIRLWERQEQWRHDTREAIESLRAAALIPAGQIVQWFCNRHE